jgi:hypothetical protein
MHKVIIIVLIFISGLLQSQALKVITENDVLTGAQQFNAYLPKLNKKKVAIVTNVTGKIGNTTIVDTLIKLKVTLKKYLVLNTDLEVIWMPVKRLKATLIKEPDCRSFHYMALIKNQLQKI